MAWVRVVSSADVPPGAVATVEVPGPHVPAGEVPGVEVPAVEVPAVEVVVWRTVEGRVVVCDTRCPHQWSHLGYEGAVDGCELVCVTHWWRFDAEGHGSKLNVLGRRDPKGDLEVFASREVDGWVEADLP